MQVAAWTFCVGFVAAGVYSQFLAPWDAANLLVGVICLGVAWFFTTFANGSIELYPDAVVLDGWYRSRREIPLINVVEVEPDRYGLFFRLGPHEGASGPNQIGAKGLGLRLMKVRTRGDRIAEAIIAAAAVARVTGSEPGIS